MKDTNERIKKLTPIKTAIESAREMLLEALIQRFGSVPGQIEDKVGAIQRENICKKLLREVFICRNIEEFKEVIFKSKKVSGKSGLDLQQNYDAVIKWIAQEFKGKTLKIFGIKTEPIIDVFNFEPVEIRADTGRLDLMFKDKKDAIYHIEEQRNMQIDDLHRFGVYHFQASRRWGENITDIILMSGRTYAGAREIKTKSGTYSPKIVDLTEKDGQTRLKQIKEEVDAGEYGNLIELVFIPLYGKGDAETRSRLALAVLEYEVKLLKKDKLMDKLVVATIIMANKIVDKATLKRIYEEVKNMLDILEIAREDGMEKGRVAGRVEGKVEGKVEMARAFKEKGINIKIIADTSGIPIEQVKML
jgi:hypothetical protein